MYIFSPSGLISVLILATSMSQSFFPACLISCLLALTCLPPSSWLTQWPGGGEDLIMAQQSILFLMGILLLGYLGCLCSHRRWVIMFLWLAVDHYVPGIQDLCFDSGFRRGKSLLLCFLYYIELPWPCIPSFMSFILIYVVYQ